MKKIPLIAIILLSINAYCEENAVFFDDSAYKHTCDTNFNDEFALSAYSNEWFQIYSKFKAYYEWPGVSFIHKNTLIKIKDMYLIDDNNIDLLGKEILLLKDGLYIKTNKSKRNFHKIKIELILVLALQLKIVITRTNRPYTAKREKQKSYVFEKKSV